MLYSLGILDLISYLSRLYLFNFFLLFGCFGVSDLGSLGDSGCSKVGSGLLVGSGFAGGVSSRILVWVGMGLGFQLNLGRMGVSKVESGLSDLGLRLDLGWVFGWVVACLGRACGWLMVAQPSEYTIGFFLMV